MSTPAAMRRVARIVALIAVGLDLFGAWLDWQQGGLRLGLRRAAIATGIALIPCAVAFASVIVVQARRPARWRGAVGSVRLPVKVPRAYVGVAVLGGMATLAAMGERFGFYILLAGVALIALALSQARPRNALRM